MYVRYTTYYFDKTGISLFDMVIEGTYHVQDITTTVNACCILSYKAVYCNMTLS